MNWVMSATVITLWVGCGIGNIILAAIDTEAFWVRIVTFLCGVLTLLMSVLFASYIKHLVSHSKDRDDFVKDNDCMERRNIMCQKLDLTIKLLRAGFNIPEETETEDE